MEMNLAGQWNFKEDRDRKGIAEKWFLQEFTDPIAIPGTMAESGYGDVPEEPYISDLNYNYLYRGWAWYQTEFSLTEEQATQNITLFLERIQWDSFIWVDGKYIGNQNSLSVPHQYPLKGLTAGRHKLVILIDNSNLETDAQLPEMAENEGTDDQGRNLSVHLHTVKDNTKKLGCGMHLIHYAYNGMVGEVKLVVKPGLHIERTEIVSDIHAQTVKASVYLRNEEQYTGMAELSIECQHASKQTGVLLTGEKEQMVCMELSFNGNMRLWDEFDPFVYTFTVTCSYENVIDTDIVRCGLRELRYEGQHIYLNDHRLFLRATLEGVAFPYTAYTPMDEEFWLRAFRILKTYGLNGMRMHTFIPPKAAFEAAEQVGFYLQIELPSSSCPSTDEEPKMTAYLWDELKKTLERYGNYASFLFMAMGNEQLVSSDKEFLARHQKLLVEKVAYAKEEDPRHLYTCTAHPHTDGRNDDFYLVATKDELVLNGIAWGGPDPITTSRFSLEAPSTTVTFEEGVKRMDKPVFTHEVGQWAVYPNFAEMPKYTGVLKPRNYEMLAAELEKNGLLHQNTDFVWNSGQLSLLLYKEEIESALRTPDLSGFELLDIHDYPGQGTSTVGILDCFFDPKGLITPEEYRNFCAPAVALCSFEKYVYRFGETMEVTPMVANYSKDAVQGKACLSVTASNGTVLYEQNFAVDAPQGGLSTFTAHSITLTGSQATAANRIADTPQAIAATITLAIEGTSLTNSWKIWIYPELIPVNEKTPIIVTALDEKAEQLLKEGKDLLYIQPYGTKPENGCQGSFTSQFWNPFMKPQETKNGIMCDPNHPIFNHFPTDSHTNYQWWEILKESYFMYLDELPLDYFPIVQIVPGIKDNRKIGLIWEGKVEKGRLLVCSADLRECQNRPAAAQLLYSIQSYMNSDEFDPQQELDIETLRKTLK